MWRCLRCPEHKFQFTPLREGRRETGIHMRDCERISIHAPPRGATGRGRTDSRRGQISIHAPPRGATRPGHARFCRPDHFNSRPSARGDLFPSFCCLNAFLFQFTPLREGRHGLPHGVEAVSHFNSRPSARGDHSLSVSDACIYYFNSRPSARGDPRKGEHGIVVCRISIHAPPRGATARMICGAAQCIFQFTPLREGRRTDGGA